MGPTVEEAARALGELLALEESALEEMGRRGRDLVTKNFSWSKIASQMFAVCKWLLGRSGHRIACGLIEFKNTRAAEV